MRRMSVWIPETTVDRLELVALSQNQTRSNWLRDVERDPPEDDIQVQFKLDDGERREVEAAVCQDGTTISDFVRRAIDGALG